jgi:hypothetical protein
MKIARFAVVLALPLAASALAQTPRPTAPKPCVAMPRQAPPAERPRERCAPPSFPRYEEQ